MRPSLRRELLTTCPVTPKINRTFYNEFDAITPGEDIIAA
jgi:hypothetical protein